MKIKNLLMCVVAMTCLLPVSSSAQTADDLNSYYISIQPNHMTDEIPIKQWVVIKNISTGKYLSAVSETSTSYQLKSLPNQANCQTSDYREFLFCMNNASDFIYENVYHHYFIYAHGYSLCDIWGRYVNFYSSSPSYNNFINPTPKTTPQTIYRYGGGFVELHAFTSYQVYIESITRYNIFQVENDQLVYKSSLPTQTWEIYYVTLTKRNLYLSTESANVDINESVTLTTTGETGKVTWSSSDETVATVKNGVVKGLKTGTAEITAYDSGTGESVVCTVNVTGININKSTFNVKVGGTVDAVATAYPTDADNVITWTSDDESIASVDANTGTITGVSKGSAIIRATCTNGTQGTTSSAFALAIVEDNVSYDFTKPSELTPAIEAPEEEDSYISYKTANIYDDETKIDFSMGSRTGTYSFRMYSDENLNYYLKEYTGGDITISGKGTNSLTKITFTGDDINLSADKGTMTDNVWTGRATSVTFTATAASSIKNISIDYAPSVSLKLEDGTAFENTSTSYTGPVTYSRTFNHTGFQALYVPFAMNYDDWADDFVIYRLNNVHQYDDDNDGVYDRIQLEVLKMKEGTHTDANTPYMIKALSTGDKSIVLEDATLQPSQENKFTVSSWNELYTFGGTYHTVSDMQTNGYYALSGGELVGAESDDATLSPYRWYMSITNRNAQTVSAAKKVSIFVIGEEDATGVTLYPAAKETSDEAVYDIMGRRVSSASNHGVYIINNKKVLK